MDVLGFSYDLGSYQYVYPLPPQSFGPFEVATLCSNLTSHPPPPTRHGTRATMTRLSALAW